MSIHISKMFSRAGAMLSACWRNVQENGFKRHFRLIRYGPSARRFSPIPYLKKSHGFFLISLFGLILNLKKDC